MKILGIHFAPLNISYTRRLQTCGAIAWTLLMFGGLILSWFIYILLIIFCPWFRIPCLIYGAYIYWDNRTALYEDRRYQCVRSCKIWKLFRDYFPAKIVKKAELSPEKSYIFAAFPHGVLTTGGFLTFFSDAYNFEQLFPGLKPSLVTLAQHFVTPFLRQIVLAFGAIPATEKYIFPRLQCKGSAICLLVGGAEEAFYSKPGRYVALMNRRKGFLRLALTSGASLVPMFTFGEPNLYYQIENKPGSFSRRVQDLFKKMTGIAPILFVGRGIFQYTFGFLPFRTPLTTVVGYPIDVQKIENPTDEDIENLRSIFREKLIELFETEKHNCILDSENVKLNIM